MTERIILKEEDFNYDWHEMGKEYLTVELHGKSSYEVKQQILANQRVVKGLTQSRDYWNIEAKNNEFPMCKRLVNLFNAILGETK